MDFTLTIYQQLLESLLAKNYQFVTVEEYFSLSHLVASSQSRPVSNSLPRSLVLLRHDVDRKPENSLRMAKLEHELGVKATYYFRTISQTLKPEIIKEIAELGHEIGYHYENLSEVSKKEKVNPMKYSHSSNFIGQESKKELFDLAIKNFEINLEKLRKYYPVKTICMHGSPLSKWDNRDIWNKYDYRELGIEFEPYFDINYNEFYYITDTGRRWDGEEMSIRDKVKSEIQWPQYHSTNEIINALKESTFPTCVLMTIHPQRWTNNPISCTQELVSQNIKNVIKYFLIKYKNK